MAGLGIGRQLKFHLVVIWSLVVRLVVIWSLVVHLVVHLVVIWSLVVHLVVHLVVGRPFGRPFSNPFHASHEHLSLDQAFTIYLINTQAWLTY